MQTSRMRPVTLNGDSDEYITLNPNVKFSIWKGNIYALIYYIILIVTCFGFILYFLFSTRVC